MHALRCARIVSVWRLLINKLRIRYLACLLSAYTSALRPQKKRRAELAAAPRAFSLYRSYFIRVYIERCGRCNGCVWSKAVKRPDGLGSGGVVTVKKLPTFTVTVKRRPDYLLLLPRSPERVSAAASLERKSSVLPTLSAGTRTPAAVVLGGGAMGRAASAAGAAGLCPAAV